MTLNIRKKRTHKNRIQNLNKDETLRVECNRKGLNISCETGMLWITQEGDWVDRLLMAGEKFRTRIPGFVLIQALNHSRIRISQQNKVELVCSSPQMFNEELACA